MGPERPICECDTPERNRIMQQLRADCMALTNEQAGSTSTKNSSLRKEFSYMGAPPPTPGI
jgi:hypothetical protein